MDARVCMVTGATGDIGRACAHELGRRGWTLVLAEHPSAAAAAIEFRDDLVAAGLRAHTATFDVVDPEETQRSVRQIVADIGVPTGLVNNAGYQGTFAPVQSYPISDARRVMEVNVLGTMNLISHIGAAMEAEGRGGAIVNAASMAGVSGAPNMPAYSASKAAVIGLTKSAAKDLAPAGVRVNAVSPAFIGPGRMWDRQVALQASVGSQYFSRDPAEVATQMIDMVPLRRYGTTAEVAQVIAFLLSDEASYLTGVNIEIAGGSS